MCKSAFRVAFIKKCVSEHDKFEATKKVDEDKFDLLQSSQFLQTKKRTFFVQQKRHECKTSHVVPKSILNI